jgi:exopolysaccharide biosynthesis polyprenyl glycosylphosphotransferase
MSEATSFRTAPDEAGEAPRLRPRYWAQRALGLPALSPEVESWFQISPYVASAASRRTAATPGWHWKYRALQVASDLVSIGLALAASFWVLFIPGDSLVAGTEISYFWVAPVLGLVWVGMLGLTDSRSTLVAGSGMEEYRRVLSASIYVFGGLAIVSFWMKADLSRALFVTTLPAGVALLLLSRWTLRMGLQRLRSRGRALTSALVVGTASTVMGVVRDTRRHPEAGYAVAGVCILGSLDREESLEIGRMRVRDIAELEHEVSGDHYGAVIVADGLSREESRGLAWRLENRPVELLFVPRVIDVAGPRLKARNAEGVSLVHVDLPQFVGWAQALKRAFDIVLSAITLVLLIPVFVVVAVLIKLDDGGPVFFRQERVGRFGEPFTIHKFRTMCIDAEAKIDALINASGGKALLFKLEEDPRITPIGKILRKYSIDELPQFWSVLRGGMSVVGPRPQVAREVAEYSDIHHRRLLIKPGITGLWQVNGRSALSMEESIRLDLRYVENWSLLGDVVIILKTVGVVLRPNGAY